jgi:hypothetical protein
MKLIACHGVAPRVTPADRSAGYMSALRKACLFVVVDSASQHRLSLLLSSGWSTSNAADFVGIDTHRARTFAARHGLTYRRPRKYHKGVDLVVSQAL